jgi:hypothetical protein
MSKRGWLLVGGVSIFLVVLILIAFSAVGLSATLIMKMTNTVSEAKGGVVVLDEEELEVGNLYDYVQNYSDKVEVRNSLIEDWGWSYE